MGAPGTRTSLRRTIDHKSDAVKKPNLAPLWVGLALAIVVVGAGFVVVAQQARTSASSGWKSVQVAQAPNATDISVSPSLGHDPEQTHSASLTSLKPGITGPVVVRAKAEKTPKPVKPDADKSSASEKNAIAAAKAAKAAKRAAATKPGAAASLDASGSKSVALPANPPATVASTGQQLSSASSVPAQPSSQTGVSAPGASSATAPVSQPQPAPEPTEVYAPEVVVDARFITQRRPDYPEIAKQMGAQGTAVVLITIGPKGNVISAKISQSTGNAWLDQAALVAARGSTFQPPKIDGKPATETYRVVYEFAP